LSFDMRVCGGPAWAYWKRLLADTAQARAAEV
jgi:hypothetical protein